MTRINTNITSLTAQRALIAVGQSRQLNLERLSTALAINRASDDPAGLMASVQLRSEIADLQSQMSAAQRQISMGDTADAGLNEVELLLVDVRGIMTLVANDATLTDEERQAYQMELDAKIASIDNIAAHTTFNGQSLLDGFYGFSVGSDALGTEVEGYLASLQSGGDNDLDSGHAEQAADIIDRASGQVATYRGELGATQRNQWQTSLDAMGVALENIEEAESAIRDADYAVEMAGLIRNSILFDATIGVAALAGASTLNALTLLGY